MINFNLNQQPRRLEDFDVEELEAFIRRGRTLQARAMGRGLRALYTALVHGQEPASPRTEQGEVDWERVLGLAPEESAARRA